jgi:hypothetical protein
MPSLIAPNFDHLKPDPELGDDLEFRQSAVAPAEGRLSGCDGASQGGDPCAARSVRRRRYLRQRAHLPRAGCPDTETIVAVMRADERPCTAKFRKPLPEVTADDLIAAFARLGWDVSRAGT